MPSDPTTEIAAPHRPPSRWAWHGAAVAGILALAAAGLGDPVSSHQRPLKIVVPFGAGGGSDTFVRMIQKTVSEEAITGQPWVIINQKGGSGTIGSRTVMTAAADGFTILNLHDAIMTAKLSGKVPYGPEAFEPIAATGRASMMVIVPADSKFQSLKQLLDEAKKNPNTIGFGANVGAPGHFVGLLLERAAGGAKFKTIQSGGGQQRYTMLIGGHLDMGIFQLNEYINYATDGKIRALAVLDAEPNPVIPEVPTARSQGFDVVQHNTQYWWAPKGTPKEKIDAIADVLEKAMQSDSIRTQLARTHTEPLFARGESLKQIIADRMQTLGQIDMGHGTRLPDFPLWTGLLVVALMVWVAIDCWMVKDKASRAPIEGTRPDRPRAWAIAALTLVYAALLQWRLVRFAVATTLFILIAGMVLAAGRKNKPWLALGEVALLCGLGLEFVFTRILVIDLP